MQELVSIITPLYNAEEYISKTAQSVLEQSYPHWEWIVVDDGSIDNSYTTIETFKDPRIRLYKNCKNKGVVETRNYALSLAQGQYISFLDSDDCWHKDKLDKQLSFMKKENLVISFHSYQKFSGDKMGQVIHAKPSVSYRDMLRSNYIGCLTCMVNKEKVGSLKMIEGYKAREDWIFWLEILKKNKTVARSLPDVLAYYRIVENSLSSKKVEMIKEQYRVYREVLGMNIVSTSYYLARYLSIGFKRYIK